MYNILINTINLNIKLNNKKFILNIKKSEKCLVLYLIKLNIIKFIKKWKNKYIVSLNLLKNNKTIFNLKNIYKISNIKYINKNNSKKFLKSKNIIIINTNLGIKNNYESFLKNIGGIGLFILWN